MTVSTISQGLLMGGVSHSEASPPGTALTLTHRWHRSGEQAGGEGHKINESASPGGASLGAWLWATPGVSFVLQALKDGTSGKNKGRNLQTA